MLWTFYSVEVEKRNRDFLNDDNLAEQIIKTARYLSQDSYSFGLLLTGPCGTGKTTLMLAIRELITHLFKNGTLERMGIEINPELPLLSAKDIINQVVKNPTLYRRHDILFIDDLGHEPTEIMNYGMIYTPIIDLLEARYKMQKYTIITTNLKSKDLRQKYGERIADRFNEMMEIVEFDGETFRVI